MRKTFKAKLSGDDSRSYMQLLGIFAAIAALMAVMGVYGVMSYLVSKRTHEIGIRVALGAQRNDVLGLFVTMGLRLAIMGVVAGIAGSLMLTRVIASFLFGVKPSDPPTYAIVAAALIAVALLASYIPARRATKLDLLRRWLLLVLQLKTLRACPSFQQRAGRP